MDKTKLPVLVLKNIILFPHNEIRIELENDKDKELASLADSYYNKHILIINPNDELEESIDKTSFPRIGVIGYINMRLEMPNNKTRIVIRGLNRVKVLSYSNSDSDIPVSYFEEKGYLIKEGLRPRLDYLKIIDMEGVKYEKKD